MDHLPFPHGTQPPIVPFVGSLYDGERGSFSRYDRRKGMRGDIRTCSFVRVEPGVYQAFFQTWLYFGCLKEVSRIIQLPFDTTSFVRRMSDGAEIVTSAGLNDYLDRWRDCEMARPRGNEAARRRQRLVEEVLRKMRRMLRGPLQEFRRFLASVLGHDSPATLSWSNIALSIAALGYTFLLASDRIYGSLDGPTRTGWGVQWALRERLADSHWCRALMAKFLADQRIDFCLFVSSIPFPRRFEDHDRCTDAICRGRIANSTEYKTAHVAEGCACRMWEMDSSAAEIVRAGGVPLATWSDEEGLKVVECQPNMVYVAISHVWSDGKGNRVRNELPECQLKSIQAKVEALYATPRRECPPSLQLFGPRTRHEPRDPLRQPRGFWMDTLCVPVGESQKGLRRIAIMQMRAIYEGADRVLVLDDRIERLSVASPFCDRAVGLIISNWQSRIWTLQEGIMAQRLFIQFSDGVSTLQELQKEEGRRANGRAGRGELVRSPSLAFWHRVTPSVLTVLSIGLHFNSEQRDTRTFAPDALFSALIPVAQNRLTSWREDETICLSALMRLDQQQLLDVQWKYTWDEKNSLSEQVWRAEELRVCEERMKLFLCMIRRFDKDLIFNELPRLSGDGFGWAPSSFLGQTGVTKFVHPEWFHKITVGIGRRAPILFSDALGSSKVPRRQPEDALGLLVTFPGIMLHPVSSSLISAGTFYVRERRFKRLLYRVVLQGSPPPPHPQHPAEQHALVTLGAATLERGSSPIPAVFGVFIDMMDNRVRKLRHRCLAWVTVMKRKRERVNEKGESVKVCENEFEKGEGWMDDDSDSWKSAKDNRHGKSRERRLKDDNEYADREEVQDVGSAPCGQRSERGSEVGHAGEVVGEANDGSENDGNTNREVYVDDEDGNRSDDEQDGEDYYLNEYDGYSSDRATSAGQEHEHGLDAEKKRRDEPSTSGSDDDSSEDADSADDDLHAKRRTDGVATANPSPEEVVYGKILFMDKNKWCII